jgi:hypothetical protein
MAEPRTKQTAIDTLEAMRQEVVQKLEDKEIAVLLSEGLLKSIFNEAWRLQFDDDTAQFTRAARDLVVEVANQSKSEEPR